MKFLFGAILLLISAQAQSTSANSSASGKFTCSHGEGVFQCVEYVDNYDGDTVTVNIPRIHHFFGRSVPVRVADINAPEMRADSKCAREAAKLATRETRRVLAKAKRIGLKNVQRGKYFRIVAEVVYDGKSLAEHLLKLGLVEKYDGKRRDEGHWCQKVSSYLNLQLEQL